MDELNRTTASEVNEVEPIWDRAHRTMNDMRESLLAARDQAEQDGQAAANRVAAINEALNRITPPVPTSVPQITSGTVGPITRGPAQPRYW